MKLSAQDYELLIKSYASQLSLFGRNEGTSLTYQYMRDTCNRLIEISNEYQANFPKEAKKEYDN